MIRQVRNSNVSVLLGFPYSDAYADNADGGNADGDNADAYSDGGNVDGDLARHKLLLLQLL